MGRMIKVNFDGIKVPTQYEWTETLIGVWHVLASVAFEIIEQFG